MFNIIQIRHFKFLITFIIFRKLLINCESICSDFTDCFNCTMCGDENSKYCNCAWQTISGISYCEADEFRYLSDWYTELLKCKYNDDQIEYCSGEDTSFTKNDLTSDYTLIFTLNSDNYGNFGKKMLFCYYKYIDEEGNDYTLNIQFSNKVKDKPKVAYGCNFKEGEEKIQKIEEDKEISCSGIKKIFFMVLLNDNYSSSPIQFKIILKNLSAYKYVTAFSIAIVILLLMTCIICCITRFYNNRARRQLRLLMNQRAHINMIRIQQENDNMVDFNENSENLEEINKNKLDILFSKSMIEHLYKSEYNKYGGGCSICLENFKKKSKVSKTPCNHVFHYKCIKDWLYKNAKNPKCPNCNKEVLNNDEIDITEKIDETKIIKVKKKNQDNQNNNILNNNLNFGTRNNFAATININRASNFNIGGRGDFSQSQRQQLGDY